MSNTFSYNEAALSNMPDATEMRIGLVVAEWNNTITDTLMNHAMETLIKHGVKETNITIERVPGSFELVYGCAHMMDKSIVDAIIAIGCVVKGDTPHFDYICEGTTLGLVHLNLRAKIPVINGILTVNTQSQAEERANTKGQEFALTAIRMAVFDK